MPTVQLSMLAGAGAQFFGDNGRPLSGGKVYTYNAGTTTPRAVYTTSAGTVAHANPIVLDAAGRVPGGGEIWVEAEVSYKFALTTWGNVPVGDWDNITGNGSGIFPVLAAPSGSSLIGFIQSGVGAVARTAQSKMRERVSVEDFGAVGDGVTDSTAGLQNALKFAIASGKTLVLQGNYTISAALLGYGAQASGAHLHLRMAGNTTITVSAGATAFDDVLYFQTPTACNVSITGAPLVINGNNKVGRGISIVHTEAASGGTVAINAPVLVQNILDNNASGEREVTGITVVGRFTRVVMDQPCVRTVNRTRAVGQATKGISVSGVDGKVTLNSPEVDTILCVDSSRVDADGIAVFGRAANGLTSAREGSCEIITPTFINCQGRSFKGQISDVVIYRPRVIRTGDVVVIQNGTDFDFQASGDALLHEPVYEYYTSGGISPFSVAGSSFKSVAFQQTLDNRNMSGRSIGGTVYTEVQYPRYCSVISAAGAKRAVVEVADLKVIPSASFTSSVFTNAIVEIPMGVIESKTDKTEVIVRNVEGPFAGINAIGYTGYTSGSLNTKFSWAVVDCKSTLAGTMNRCFNTLSGTAVGEVESFLINNNYRFRDLLQAQNTVFSFANLVPGCKFSVDLSALVSVANPPPWAASGYATIECKAQWFNASDTVCDVYVGNATTSGTVFHTQNGGATWGQIK